MHATSCGRRKFLGALGLGGASMAVQGCRHRAMPRPGRSKPPNILILFTDDQRFNTIHALNNPEIQTPNMDRLVRNGTAFTHAHTMGAMTGALCVPSRAMLMTGRTLFHLARTGNVIPPKHVALPELLREHRYATFATGKWHNDRRSYARCFTHGAKIFFGGMSDHLNVPVYDFDPTGEYAKEDQYVAKTFSSELFSNAAIQFLEERPKNVPFMMYVAYTAPHDPRMAPEQYTKLYPPEKIQLPPNFMPKHPFDNGDLETRDERLAPWPRTPQIIREHIAAYYAMITHVDAQIGRVLAALAASGEQENTIIVFAGDNGLAVGQHGLLGKQNLYEHSVRVPLIFCGPGVPRGQTRDALCYLLDVFPTLCDLVGVSAPETVEGKSLAPLFGSPNSTVRDSIFYAYKRLQRGVRVKDWKLIQYNVKGKRTTQLFDLHSDPWERNNLADDTSQAQRVRQLNKLLENWMERSDDPCKPDEFINT